MPSVAWVIMENKLYLDCYHFGATGGESFPVQTYGPDTYENILALQQKLIPHFHKTCIVADSEGQSPVSLRSLK